MFVLGRVEPTPFWNVLDTHHFTLKEVNEIIAGIVCPCPQHMLDS